MIPKELQQHYENINSDIRNEIKQRITQRDSYSVQMIVSVGVLLTIAFGNSKYDKVIIALPLFSIYYTMLILYSYKIHKNLTDYLVYELYPIYSTLYEGISIKSEWELYHQINQTKPGIRKIFFKTSMPIVSIFSFLYLICKYPNCPQFLYILIPIYLVYFISNYLILCVYFKNVASGAQRDYPRLKGRIKKSKKNIAVFLDRDGTINVDKHFPYKKSDLEIPNESFDALAKLSTQDIKVIVITNQSGIALGKFTKRNMMSFNRELLHRVKINNGRIDAIYYSTDLEPTHSENEKLSSAKPSPDMVTKAQKDYNIDLEKSYLIGDKGSDIALGNKLKMHSILVKTGKAGKDPFYEQFKPDYEAINILEAVDIVIQKIKT